MVWTICPYQLAQQDTVLIVCAHGKGQHIPSFEHSRQSSSRPRCYNNGVFWHWHSLQFVSGCCIVAVCWNLCHFTMKFNFLDELLYCLTEILGEHCSGSSLNFWLLILVDNLFFSCSRLDWRCFWGWVFFVAESSLDVTSCSCVSNCTISSVLFTCSHSTHSTSVALTVHTFLP